MSISTNPYCKYWKVWTTSVTLSLDCRFAMKDPCLVLNLLIISLVTLMKRRTRCQDHQTADVVQHSIYYCHWESYDKRQNLSFIKLALLPQKEHNTTVPSRNMLAMLDIPNMFGSWPFLTATEKVMISVKTCFSQKLVTVPDRNTTAPSLNLLCQTFQTCLGLEHPLLLLRKLW